MKYENIKEYTEEQFRRITGVKSRTYVKMIEILKWVEDTLIKDGTFSLPGRKKLLQSDMEYDVILLDATESLVERPKKQRSYYSGKKKRQYIYMVSLNFKLCKC